MGEQKFLFCFDLDETITHRHSYGPQDITPQNLKYRRELRSIIEQALHEGHKVAITTNSNPENVQKALEMVLEGSHLTPKDVIMTTGDKGGSCGKNYHIEEALRKAGPGYAPILIDDSEENILQAGSRPNWHGVRVWTDSDGQPAQEALPILQRHSQDRLVSMVGISHLLTIADILAAPHAVESLCEAHNDSLTELENISIKRPAQQTAIMENWAQRMQDRAVPKGWSFDR